MRSRKELFPLALLTLLLFVNPSRGLPEQDLSNWTIVDIEGIVHNPANSPKTVAVVFVYVDITCPIANFYQPALRRLAETFEPKGIRFYQVHPDPDGQKDALAEHAKAYAVTSPVVLDAKQILARRHDAKVTPEAHVFLADGSRLYRGRIDNTYATYGKRRPEATSHDLRAALQSTLAGRKPAKAVTKAVGCQILIELHP